MKIFLLVMTITLLIGRIKSTPRMLSKTLYRANLSKAICKQKEATWGKDEDYIIVVQGVAIGIVLLFQILMIVYYSLIGSRFSSNTIVLVLTALQIVMVFISFKMQLNKNTFSQNIDDHKFYRFYFLCNVILDYVYYPMVIYLLVT